MKLGTNFIFLLLLPPNKTSDAMHALSKKNIEDREIKAIATTRKIIASCGNEIFRKMQLKALLKMHNACTVASPLTNCEIWVLNKGEWEKLEKIELWALKKILDVSKTTPTPAIWYIIGQLLYLKTILDRPDQDWTKLMLNCLQKDDIGQKTGRVRADILMGSNQGDAIHYVEKIDYKGNGK